MRKVWPSKHVHIASFYLAPASDTLGQTPFAYYCFEAEVQGEFNLGASAIPHAVASVFFNIPTDSVVTDSQPTRDSRIVQPL